jgi:hypothetical protein
MVLPDPGGPQLSQTQGKQGLVVLATLHGVMINRC